MKGRILNIMLVLVLAALPMAANAGRSEAQQATDQALPAPSLIEESPAPDAEFNSSPVLFIENAGQWDDGARFQVWGGPATTVWLAEDAIWITVLEARETSRPVDRGADPALRRSSENQEELAPRRGVNIKLSFVGANPQPRMETFQRLDTTVSYFLGDDSEQWRPAVPVWGRVRYLALYPGIDLEVTGEDGRLAPRVIAAAGADLSALQLRVEGAEEAAIEGAMLRLRAAGRDIAWPLLQAGEPAGAVAVRPRGAGIFDIALPFAPSTAASPPTARPEIPADNPADLLYSTFLGGSSYDGGYAIAVDGAGSAYVTGWTESSDFPATPGAFDRSHNGDLDAFVAKLNPAGSGLAYATFLGGNYHDYGRAIAVDGAGSAYVTGDTSATNFPTTPGAFDTSYHGGRDAFVAKLNPAGSGLAYATFLGGSDGDRGDAIAVDGTGSVYVTGDTESSDFPATPGAFDRSHNGYVDAFVVKLNPAGSGLAYATFLGGRYYDFGYAIAVDGTGSAYVAGWTDSSDFPTTPGAFDRSYHGSGDAFVVKLNPAGSGLAYATFLGGSVDDGGRGIAVDGAGSAYVTGVTYSSDFPTTPGAFDRSYNGWYDVFVAKLNPAGSDLAYATFLGGSIDDIGTAIAVDGAGSAYVAGYTRSGDFPTTPGAFNTSHNGGDDVFVVKLNPAGSVLAYATFLGGSSYDGSHAIAVDGAGRAYVTGYTWSSDFPTTPGAFDRSHNGSFDAFVAKLAVTKRHLYLPLVLRRFPAIPDAPVLNAITPPGPIRATTSPGALQPTPL